MDYIKHYYKLVTRAKTRNIDVYLETHHIIPRCVGGSDTIDNLVRLTPEEHYLAHQILVKIFKGNSKILNASIMMRPSRPSNKLYGWLKKKYSKIRSGEMSGEGNTNYGKFWIHSKVEKRSKLLVVGEKIPDGWEIGRKIKFSGKPCQYCGIEHYKNANTCSPKCRSYLKSESIKIIDENLQNILDDFIVSKSITKTLKKYNISGRRGNSHLSGILKSMGIPVLRRRNTAGIA